MRCKISGILGGGDKRPGFNHLSLFRQQQVCHSHLQLFSAHAGWKNGNFCLETWQRKTPRLEKPETDCRSGDQHPSISLLASVPLHYFYIMSTLRAILLFAYFLGAFNLHPNQPFPPLSECTQSGNAPAASHRMDIHQSIDQAKHLPARHLKHVGNHTGPLKACIEQRETEAQKG